MKKIYLAIFIQWFCLLSVASAEPVLSYECSGLESFRGRAQLIQDRESRLPGVDETYFGVAYHYRDSDGSLRGLVMMLMGRNQGEDINRICFAWSVGFPVKRSQALSTSISSDDQCSGFTSRNGSLMTLVANGPAGALSCNLKIEG